MDRGKRPSTHNKHFLDFYLDKKKKKKNKNKNKKIQYEQSIVHQHKDPFHNHIKETLKEFLNT